MKKFQAGDVVVLKSGGPNMTVQYYSNNIYVSCIWFAEAYRLNNGGIAYGNAKPETCNVSEEALEKVK